MRKIIPGLMVFVVVSIMGLASLGAQPSAMAPAAPVSGPMVVTPAPMAVVVAPMEPAPAMEATASTEVSAMAPEPTPVTSDAMGVEAAPPVTSKPANEATKPTSDKKQDAWWKVLAEGLIQVALAFLSFLLLGIGGIFVKWLLSKMKVTDATTVQKVEELYDTAITLGTDYARQMARKLSDDPDANGKKVQWAMDMIQKLITDWKLPEKTADWVKARIEAKLGQERKPV